MGGCFWLFGKMRIFVAMCKSDNSKVDFTGLRLAISKEVVNELPVVTFNYPIVVIDNAADALSAVAYLKKHSMIGFDTETRPTFRKGEHHNVALVQLSTSDTSFLFRINKFGFTEPLQRLMENPEVLKIGLSTKDDFHGLNQLAPITPRGVIELQQYVRRWGITEMSLQKVYAIVRGGHITKGQRLTNWEAPTLTPSQKQYASIDAWACLDIYNALENGEFDPLTSPYNITDEEI